MNNNKVEDGTREGKNVLYAWIPGKNGNEIFIETVVAETTHEMIVIHAIVVRRKESRMQ